MPEITEQRFHKLEDKVGKIYDQMKDLNKNSIVLHESFQNFNKEFEEFRKRFEKSVIDTKDLKKDMQAMQAENRTLKKEIAEMRSTVEDINVKLRENELDIVGPEVLAKMGKKQLAEKLTDSLSIKLNESDILLVKDFSMKNKKVSGINLKLRSKALRDSLLEKGRKARLKGAVFGDKNDNTNVFFNETLSPYTRMILNASRAFKSAEGYSFLWVKNGNVFLRKKEKEKAIRISSMADLEALKKGP